MITISYQRGWFFRPVGGFLMSKVRVMRKFYIIAISLFALIGCRDSVETPRHTIGFASQVNRSIVEGVEDLHEGGGN